MNEWKRTWTRFSKRYYLMRFLAGIAMLWTMGLVTRRAWPDKLQTPAGLLRYILFVLFTGFFLGWLVRWERVTFVTLRRRRQDRKRRRTRL